MDIIKSSDAIEALAKELGVPGKALSKWRERGQVAGRWIVPIMNEAERCGMTIDRAAFDDYRPSSRRKAA